MWNFINKWLNVWAVKRIKNNPQAKDLLLEMSNGFDILHEKISKDSTLSSIGNALPDMMWAKDLEGRYIWANQRIIDRLLFSGSLENTIGRLDRDMAAERIAVIGADKHTFGIVCGNSDFVVLDTEEPERFLEFGLVTGEDMYLEVHKNVLRDINGEVIGTVGTGREITEEYLAYQAIADKLDATNVDIPSIKEEIQKLMNKYYFEA